MLPQTINCSPRDYVGLTPLFWTAYLDRRGLGRTARAELVRRANLHVAACVLARVDGKSPVEYLEARGQAIARSFARQALIIEPGDVGRSCASILEDAIGGGIEWQR